MNLKLLKELCDCPGIPGSENLVSKIVRRELKKFSEEIITDPMGNVIFKITDNDGPRILVDANMDEVGFIVSHIEEGGIIRVIPLGGIDPKLFYGQRLTIWGKSEIDVTVGAVPPHIRKDGDNAPEIDDCIIDSGIEYRILKQIVKVGDSVTFSTNCVIDNNRVLSNALDDRVGLFVAIETVKKLKKQNLKCQLTVSASVQEEMGLRGARIINSRVSPDFSIALEGTVSNDLPGVPKHKTLAKLRNGPEIRISDKYLIADRDFNAFIENIAKSKKINYQLTAKNAGGTNSTAFQVTGEGSKATVLSVPVRYLHSPSSVAILKDIEQTIKLLSLTISNIHKFK